jgi:hypothetical protein
LQDGIIVSTYTKQEIINAGRPFISIFDMASGLWCLMCGEIYFGLLVGECIGVDRRYSCSAGPNAKGEHDCQAYVF